MESELRRLIDPDKIMVMDARWRAIEYVADRIPELVGGRKVNREEYRRGYAAWFFQACIPMSEVGYLAPTRTGGYFWYRQRNSQRTRSWQW